MQATDESKRAHDKNNKGAISGTFKRGFQAWAPDTYAVPAVPSRYSGALQEITNHPPQALHCHPRTLSYPILSYPILFAPRNPCSNETDDSLVGAVQLEALLPAVKLLKHCVPLEAMGRYQGVCQCVATVLPRRYQGVARVLSRCYQVVTKVLPTRYNGVTKVLPLADVHGIKDCN